MIASKDASDHTFAVKTANWGWQQFAKRDQLFQDPHVLQADSFVISCTIQAQPQPPAGYWLGMGLPPSVPFVSANAVVGSRQVGSGGGLSAWAGGEGASGGVAGGTTAAGGVKKVVPRDLVSSVGALLDDPRESRPMANEINVAQLTTQSTPTSSSSSLRGAPDVQTPMANRRRVARPGRFTRRRRC